MIKSWSFSRLSEFETCAYRAKLKIIDRIPEPERQLKPGQTEHANDRGTRIHDACEVYIRGNGDLPAEAAKHFKAEFASLKTRFSDGAVSLEGEWGYDRDWEPCEYKKAWCKVKCDAVVHLSPKHIVVIDYKTGRKFGNEIKHGEQVQLYAVAASLRYPEVETIDVELWYLDQDDMTHLTKPVEVWMRSHKLYDRRGNKMTTATEFKPTPSAFACQWCPYKDGICEHAYTDKDAAKKLFIRKAQARKGGK